ncbi:MAG TPA: hypothetical protein VFD36_02100 [Kofleriaceae bacterium]|nr:hypothetical protein [Kofleriaceae bacterium]
MMPRRLRVPAQVVTTIGARRLKARAQIATVIGLPLAAAALVTDVFLLIWRYAGGIPPLRDELPGHGLVALLSAAVLFVALRSWRRTRRGGQSSISPRLTRLIPLLVGIGVAGGLFVGNAWGHDAVDLDRRVVTDMCEQLLPAGPHGDPAPAALASCIDVAIGCREAGAAADRESRLREPGDPWSGGAWFACVKSRLPPVP